MSYGQIDGNFKESNIVNGPYQTGEYMAPFDKEVYFLGNVFFSLK